MIEVEWWEYDSVDEMADAVDCHWGSALEGHWREMIDAALSEKAEP